MCLNITNGGGLTMNKVMVFDEPTVDMINAKVNEMIERGCKYVDLKIQPVPVGNDGIQFRYIATFVYDPIGDLSSNAMTWNLFTYTILSARFFGATTDLDVILILFDVAGCKCTSDLRLSVSTLKNWLNNREKCYGTRYFPDGIDESCFTGTLLNNGEEKLHALQKRFRDTIGNRSIIDVDTDNMYVFACSITKQFKELIGFHGE